jgi:ParB family transcriptional regulator, chromosome partitioning protein
VFTRLLDMDDKTVLRILAVIMAETLAAGTDLVDALGSTLKVDVGQYWQPDDTYFTLVKDRDAVSAMLVEVIGETAAKSHLIETGSKKKAIIRKALDGDGPTKVEPWTPRYLAFPQRGYTLRPLRAASVRRGIDTYALPAGAWRSIQRRVPRDVRSGFGLQSLNLPRRPRTSFWFPLFPAIPH